MKNLLKDYPQALDDLIEYLTTKIYALGTIDLVDMRAAMRARAGRPPKLPPMAFKELNPKQRKLLKRLREMPPWKRKEIFRNLEPKEKRRLKRLIGKARIRQRLKALTPRDLAMIGRKEKTDAVLTGRVNFFEYDEDNVGKSYIEMTIRLIDTKDGMILWTTPMKGELEALTNAFINTLSRHQMMEKRR
jgi:hypothetical protein